MKDIDYIKQRLEEVYKNYYDTVNIKIEEHEKTYALYIKLCGVNDICKMYEINKEIINIGETLNYIYSDIEKWR